MRQLAKPFAVGAWIFGAVALALGSFGVIGSAVGIAASSGCDRMMYQLVGVGSLLLSLLGAPHVLAATAFLRGWKSGARWMSALCVLNVLVNAAIATLLVLQGTPALAVFWIALIALNAFGVIAVRFPAAA